MKLFYVTVECDIMVEAEDKDEATRLAESCIGKDGTEPMGYAHEIKTVVEVPMEWQDSIPFGGDKNDFRTCRERLTQIN